MALSNSQQAAFNQQISRMREDGFFLPDQRSLVSDTQYLIIGLGGTGADALFHVKKEFEAVLPKDQLKNQVRFLVVDSDRETQQATKRVFHPDGASEIVVTDRLTNDQFIQLSGDAARMSLHVDDSVTQWMNPQLREMILNGHPFLHGCGASGIRQVGRLLLYPGSTVSAVTGKIQNLVHELTHDNSRPLYVMLLSGIAGGTGSSLVIDLTYLIRNILENMPGNLDSPAKNATVRTKYCGFILLPPTGPSYDPAHIHRGNRNGYAAMKEINHFMNIDARSGEYRMTYGDGRTVSSGKNIFDVCYLLDGSCGDVAYMDPRGKAIQDLTASILDMVTAAQPTFMGGTLPAVNHFMNDHAAARPGIISSLSVAAAMRDADYNYCALGREEFAMPSHEIKAYVAKQMFEQIHRMFMNCCNVDAEEAKSFLRTILQSGAKTRARAARSIDEEIAKWFANISGGMGGPYYVVNLLRNLIEEVHVLRGRPNIFRLCMATDEELDNIESCALHLNNTTFEVYTAAMDALRDMLSEQFGTVIKMERGQKSYTFMPVSLGSLENAHRIIDYLDGLVCASNLRNLTNDILQEMMDHRDEWTALVRSEDPDLAPAAMRQFWNNQLDKIVNTTLEDFLIKYYSGDSNAYYSIGNHNQTYPYLQQAAQAIFHQMLGSYDSALPTVGLTGNGLQPRDFNVRAYLIVPERAPNLYHELCNIAMHIHPSITVLKSTAADQICCYRQYVHIPAFKLRWVFEAEQNYENSLRNVSGIGLHLCEPNSGFRWLHLPNLLPMSTWNMLPMYGYRNPREESHAEHARGLIDHANILKLTRNVNFQSYTVRILPPQYRPAVSLFHELDCCIENTDVWAEKRSALEAAADQCAAELYARIADNFDEAMDAPVLTTLTNAGIRFQNRELFFPGTVVSGNPHDVLPDDWYDHMAACLLRKVPDVMAEVGGTILVLDKLKDKIAETLWMHRLLTQFAHYLVTGMFRYNETEQTWEYLNRFGDPEMLLMLNNPHESMYQYYLMFTAFRENADAISGQLFSQLKAVAPIMEYDEPCIDYAEKEAAFETAAKKLMQELKSWILDCPIDPYIKAIEAQGIPTKDIKEFYHALYSKVKELVTFGFLLQSLSPDQELF